MRLGLYVLLTTFVGCSLTPAALAGDVTHAQASAFGKKLEASISRGDASVFEAALDVDAIMETAAKGLHPSKDFLDGAKSGLRENSIPKQMVAAIKAGGSYRFLRAHGTPGAQRALFRFISTAGLNYEDLELSSNPDGSILVKDLYIYSMGERLSDSSHRLMAPVLTRAGSDLQPAGVDDAGLKGVTLYERFAEQTQNNQPKEALKIYDQMPESLQHEKVALLLRLTDLQRIDEAQYAQAMDDYQQRFPRDPSCMLISIDSLYLKKQFAQLQDTLDRLDKSLGGDPYLDFYRGNGYVVQGDTAKARALFTNAIKAEPTLNAPYLVLIDLAVARKDNDEIARLLDLTETNTNFHFSDNLNNVPTFAAFMQSEAYRRWLAERSSTSTTPAPAR